MPSGANARRLPPIIYPFASISDVHAPCNWPSTSSSITRIIRAWFISPISSCPEKGPNAPEVLSTIGWVGEFENEPQPPIPPAPEENVKKAQIEDEGIIEQKTDGFTDEEKKSIEDQFNKKAEQRAGVFKIKIAEVDASTFKNGRIGVSERNLCAKEQYTKKLLYVKSDQENITKIKIKFPDGTEKTYNNPSETGTRAAPRLFTRGSDPKRYMAPIWDGTDSTKGILGKKENGVQAGVYGITAYAEIESTLEEEGTTELKKEIETPTITFNVSCCDKAGTTKLTDIPEAGLC